MAKRARRTTRRLRRYKRVSYWSQYNTLRTKCEYYTPVVFPTQQAGAGQPFFTNTTGNDKSWINFQQMMGFYPKNTALREMFAYCIVTGVKFELIPHSTNTAAGGLSNQVPVILGLLPGLNQEQANMSFSELQAVNTVFQADPNNRQIKYYSLKGGQYDLKIAGDSLNTPGPAGQVVVRAYGNGIFTQSPSWNLKVTLYVYWRYAKIL